MKIDACLVRELRKQNAWSQDQLSTVSGLSLRTVQRIEKTGICSLETKKALASVFEIDVVELEFRSHENGEFICNLNNKKYGYFGVALGFICSYGGITFSLLNEGLTFGQAGLYYGSIGALCGICGATIGIISNRNAY